MKAGLVGGSYQQSMLPFDAQRSVNLFVVQDQYGRETTALYSAPGLLLFVNTGTGPGRAAFAATNGRAFVVSGSNLIEIQSDGTYAILGSLDQSQGIVTIDENGFQLAVCDGVSLYIFTYATNIFQKVVNPNLPSAATVTFIDGYFIVSRSSSSGIFQISGIYDGLSWAALDFATAESSPDSLLRVLNVLGQLWLFGKFTTEIYSNTGSIGFPFARISGAKMETGIASPYTAFELDNSVFWVGQDNKGFGIVYRAQGFSPRVVSTEPIARRIQQAPDPLSLRCWAYQEQQHVFLVITGGGMETSLVLDVSTEMWHERAYLNEQGGYEQHLAADAMFVFGKQIVVDRNNGNIYEMNLDYFDDDGREIARDRIFTHLIDENKKFMYYDLTVGFEVGVGRQSGQGSDPKAILYLSRDGGKTFSGGYEKSIGKVGQYMTRVKWNRLGQARQMTFRVRVTDPVPVRICGAWFNTLGA